MGPLACVLRPSGSTHGRPPCFFLLSPGVVVPMVPNLISSPQVLDKWALILINQIFLLWWSCRVLYLTWNNPLSAIGLWLSDKWLWTSPTMFLKMQIGAPNRCSPPTPVPNLLKNWFGSEILLLLQMSTPFFSWSENPWSDLYYLLLFSSIVNRWK
jgi:hypothetical protein